MTTTTTTRPQLMNKINNKILKKGVSSPSIVERKQSAVHALAAPLYLYSHTCIFLMFMGTQARLIGPHIHNPTRLETGFFYLDLYMQHDSSFIVDYREVHSVKDKKKQISLQKETTYHPFMS